MSIISAMLKTDNSKPKKADLDSHAQPLNRRYNWRRIEDRQIDELIGMCKMAIGDGHVDLSEARALLNWLEQNRESADRWPANVLYSRISEIISDGVINREEEGELIDLLIQSTGQPIDKTLGQMSTSLPLCNPFPLVEYKDQSFCFTGKFFFGPRKKCEDVIVERGGSLSGAPSGKTNFLVIGVLGSSDWVHSTHGRKIESAVELREEGKGIHIISEEHWVQSFQEITS